MAKSVSMTSGSIAKNMVMFSIPIFIGQLFQQLYSIVDSLVVGNFVGEEALGAVSATGALTFLFTGFISGIFIGAGVLISKYFGANDLDSTTKSIHTSVAFSVVCGIGLTIVGMIVTPLILQLMDTPAEIIDDSVLYLRIIFAGSVFSVGYNCASSIYQAVGNTTTPLYFLIISSVLNIILNILFVVGFNMGVAGAAYATIISQAVSMILAFYFLFNTKQIYKLSLSNIKFHKGYIKDIISYGLPAGIQNSVISFANVIVQSNINEFGNDAVSGVGAYVRLEGLLFIPVSSFGFAMTTFISQNLGANEEQRAKDGARFGLITSILLSVFLGAILFIFAPQFISLFSRSENVIYYGVGRARTATSFFFLLAYANGASCILRGAGKSLSPMIVMLISFCIFRVIFIESIIFFIPNIYVVFWAYPVSWLLSCIIFWFMLTFSKWSKTPSMSY